MKKSDKLSLPPYQRKTLPERQTYTLQMLNIRIVLCRREQKLQRVLDRRRADGLAVAGEHFLFCGGAGL